MGNSFNNAINLPVVFATLIRDIKRQKKFLRRNIEALLHDAESHNDGTLYPKDFIKIKSYYGLAVPAILGEAFCLLRGYKMTNAERWVSTSQGVITGLFDDFFDDFKLPKEQITRMVENPEKIVANSSNKRLFLDFYMYALEKASFPDLIKNQLLVVHNDQVSSVEQENKEISSSRVWEITRSKGGNSVLFYRTAFDNHPVSGENNALFQLGSLMQLENDIFDVYKDAKSKITTIPNSTTQVSILNTLYTEQMEEFINLSHKMNYPKKQIQLFLNRLMPVINRGFVCLKKYQLLEESNKGVFNPASFTRNQLICDMERPGNFFNTLRYQIKHYY